MSLVFYDVFRKLILFFQKRNSQEYKRLSWAPNPWSIVGLSGSVAVLFYIQFALTRKYALMAGGCFSKLPIPVTPWEFISIPGTLAFSGLCIVEAVIFIGLAIALQNRKLNTPQNIIIGILSMVMLGTAVNAGVLTSSDIYNYRAIGQLGNQSYVKESQVVQGPYGPVTYVCSPTLKPTAYGPLFVGYMRILASAFPEITENIKIIQITAIFWFGALLLGLWLLKMPTAILTLVAINPGIIFQYIANGHNDLIGIVFIIYAMVVAKKSIYGAVALIVMAGLIKIPFVLLGCLVFIVIKDTKQRVFISAFSILTTLGLSYLLAGPNYFTGLHSVSASFAKIRIYNDTYEFILAFVAFFALGLGLIKKYFDPTLTYTMVTIPAFFCGPWYVLWALPYAICERKHLDIFIGSLPMMVFLIDDSVTQIAQMPVYFIIGGWIVYLFCRDMGKKPTVIKVPA